jgi:hypothetical protein
MSLKRVKRVCGGAGHEGDDDQPASSFSALEK